MYARGSRVAQMYDKSLTHNKEREQTLRDTNVTVVG